MAPSLAAFFPYRRPPEIDGRGQPRRTLIVVGAGPVGLAMALDWARHGHDVLVLAASDSLSEGSRAICFAKRTLEICDRLGFGDRVVGKGVSWNVGKVFRQDGLLYEFNLLPETGHERPAFVNLQQYYFEHYQLDALAAFGDRVDLRWNNRVVGVEQHDDHVALTVDCPDGSYVLRADWVVACDGAGSPVRKMLGLSASGQVFRDRFLIADVKIKGGADAFKAERWFWFDPPFHRHQSALLHRQADDVWRLDFQLGWQADPEIEKQPERVLPRIRAMLGAHVDFELEWVSVYTFQCRRMERFVHGRVIFAGDAAHQVSPFGARGANSGIQDVDNLAWKLDLVVRGCVSSRFVDSYDAERIPAADENILNSTRSTDFITPKTDISRTFRDATLELAAKYPFARKLVNSGRLSVPARYRDSPLSTDDIDAWAASASSVSPGSPALDAPLVVDGEASWLLRHFGDAFTVVLFAQTGVTAGACDRIAHQRKQVRLVVVTRAVAKLPCDATIAIDPDGTAFARYSPDGDAVYLIRPDQHVAGRRMGPSVDWIPAAIDRACMNDNTINGAIDGDAQRRTEPVAAG